MKYRIGWLLVLAVALILPSLVWNFSSSASSSASSKQSDGLREQDTAKAPVDDSYVSPGNRHKIQVNDKEYARQLRQRGARQVAEYDGSVVIEVNAALAKELKENNRGVNRDEYNLVMLNAGYIDTTTRQAQDLSTQSVGETPSGKHMRLVQFVSAVKPEWYDAMVNAGLEVVTYMPTNAYLVYGNGAAMNRFNRFAERSGVVQWQGGYHDVYKIDPLFQVEQKGKSDSGGVDTQSKQEPTDGIYTVQIYKNSSSRAQTISTINQIKDGDIKVQWDILNYTNITVPLSADDVRALASRPDIVVIERFLTPKQRDERQNQIIAGNLTAGSPTTGGDWLAYLAGKGFTQAQFTASNFAVNISDSGVDNATTTPNHFALYTAGNTTMASRVIYNRLEGTPNGGSTLQGCDGHGNINAHIVGGYVPTGAPFNAFPHADASGFRYGIGVAPFVKVGSSVIFDPNTFTFPNSPNLESKAYNDGARISSNSWGNSANSYGAFSQTYDALVRDAQPAGSTFPTAGNQEMVIVFAAGNDGPGANTSGQPGNAKNLITVGASENVHSHSTANGGNNVAGTDGCGTGDTGANSAFDIIGFSSRGPGHDQRKKPDIMAPGTHVTGGVAQGSLAAFPVTGNGDDNACFTSGGVCALPGSGASGDPDNFFPLGQQWYTTSSGTSHSTPAVAGAAALLRQFFINNGQPVPSPAMTKGIMMGHASHMTGTGANDNLWSNNQGMGLMNLNSFFDIFTTPTILRDQQAVDTFTASGQTRVITGTVVDNTKPFIVSLAWTDVPGPTSGNAFVNNLDLEVTVGGNTYRGNVFTLGNSATGGAADTRNNAEFVKVPAGVTGAFVVTIRGTNIAGDGVPNTGGALDQDYALMIYNANQAAAAVPAAAGATITMEGCTPANGAVDPGEMVTVSLCVQNVGTVNTTNLVGTLQATGGVTSPSAPQNYGVVVAGGAAVCRDFTFTANGTCGGTVTATLQLQDGATNLGTVTYNFTLGVLDTALTENFDGVTAPALPAGWTTSFVAGDADCTAGGPTCATGTNWTTDTTAADTAPNAAFHNNPGCVTDSFLVSPAVNINTAGAQLSFRNNFDVEANFDGGVLETSTNGGGTWTDILAAGGSFVSGGYNGTLNTSSTDFFNPLRGRQAWTGNSGGYITTLVNLPAAFAGQTVNFRWRLGTDCSVSDVGWRVDTVSITGGFVCCGDVEPCIITCPANVTVSNDPNQCGAVVNYSAPTSTGDCGTVTCTPPSGSFFPVGTTTVTCQGSGGGGGGAIVGGCTTETITRSSSQAITPLNSVSCNSIAGHAENSYYRAFNLSALGVTGNFEIESVSFGIEEATAGGGAGAGSGKGGATTPPAGGKKGSSTPPSGGKSGKGGSSTISKSSSAKPQGGGSQPLTVNLYTSSMAFPAGFPGSLTLIGTASIMVSDQSGTILTVPITATAPAGSELVMEVFTPDGEAVGNFFFIGSNSAGESGPSYIRAPDCGISVPTPTSTIGFPEMQIVMNVTGCDVTGGGSGPTCTFDVTVNDTQPPTITCPANVTAIGTPGQPTKVVTYPAPTAADNCPGVTTVCVPPSGSSFPVGTTTVTCTATDASGNTATCSFTVSVFDICLQDDSNPNIVVLVNSFTGDYRFCCGGTVYTGKGTVKKIGNNYTLTHNPPDRRVTIKYNGGVSPPSGSASLQSAAGVTLCTITDRDTRNNTCNCGAAVPATAGK